MNNTNNKTSNNEIHNACLILVVVLIIILCISLKYGNGNDNSNMNMNMNREGFANYQDIKNKTINWCNKMQSVGLLTPDQYNQCTASFKSVSTNSLPKQFTVPDTGMPYNYSLYDTRATKLNSNIAGENNSPVMLVSSTGLYMTCNSDSSINFISNINDSNIIQDDLYFTLLPQSGDLYMIMSSNGKYLITDDQYGVSFTGTTTGSLSSWHLTKVNDKIMLESSQFGNFFLKFNDTDNTISIVYGKDESMEWQMIPKLQDSSNSTNNVVNNIGSEYYVAKENILQKIKSNNMKLMSLNAIKDGLSALQDQIRNNYTNIENYMQTTMNNQKKVYDVTSGNIGDIGDIGDNVSNANVNVNNNMPTNMPTNMATNMPTNMPTNMATNMATNMPTTSGVIIPGDPISPFDNEKIPESSQILGSNISSNDQALVINQIINMKNYYLQQIQSEISKIDININDLQKQIASFNANGDYNKYVNNLNDEIRNIDSRIEQNNIIMGRQENDYDQINIDYSYIDDKKNKYKSLDKRVKINNDMISGYSTQNSWLNNLYPLLIVILLVILLYLAYITYIEFMDNIYSNY